MDELLKKANDARKELTGTAVDNYAIVYDNGKVEMRNDAPCLAGVKHNMVYSYDTHDYRPRPGAPKVAWFIDRWPNTAREGRGEHPRMEDQQIDTYLSWLANSSPYAAAFRTKSGTVIRTKGCVFNTNVPANLVCSAAILCRHIREHPDTAYWWTQMVRKPDPHWKKATALFLAHGFMSTGKAGFYYNMNSGNGHKSIDTGSMGLQGLRNFLNCDIKQGSRDPMSKNQNYAPMCEMWMPKRGNNPDLKYPEGKKKMTRNAWGNMVPINVPFNRTPRQFLNEFIRLNRKDKRNAKGIY